MSTEPSVASLGVALYDAMNVHIFKESTWIRLNSLREIIVAARLSSS